MGHRFFEVTGARFAPGTETYCILERFVDFWEIVEWGLGLSYNSGFSFCNLMQSDAIFIASAAAVSTLQ